MADDQSQYAASSRRVPFVPVPCPLIDDIMPSLKDSEFRLLIVVLRQTSGRRGADGLPKAADWLTHSQLKARTGRSGEAVSKAIDALCRRGLIKVHTETGTLLADAAARRRARTRLYYSAGPLLSPLLWNHGQGPVVSERSRKYAMTTEEDIPLDSRSGFLETAVRKVTSTESDTDVSQVRIEAQKGRIRALFASWGDAASDEALHDRGRSNRTKRNLK